MEVDGGASGERAAAAAAAAAAASRIRELESQVESLTERAESAERREKGAYSEIERALEENLEHALKRVSIRAPLGQDAPADVLEDIPNDAPANPSLLAFLDND